MIRRTPDGDDRGVAMLMVVASMFILTLLVVGALYATSAAVPVSRHTQDDAAALAAAKAGVDDYLQRLSADPTYWKNNGNDPSNPALVNPANPATANDWRTLPGIAIPGGAPADPVSKNTVPQYHYQVVQNYTQILSFGLITLRSTGKVNGVMRTVQVDLRQQSFLRYAYYTDKETLDPALYPGTVGISAQTAARYCNHYWFATGSDPVGRYNSYIPASQTPDHKNQPCIDPAFASGDSINGPMHTNDAMLIYGHPAFHGTAESSWNAKYVPAPQNGKLYRAYTSSSSPATCRTCHNPIYAPPVTMPPSNSALQAAADPAQGGQGCMYTGPTKITPLASGGYKVISPYTRSANPWCYNSLPIATEQTIPALPKNGVIYVQAIPANPADPNYSPSCSGFWPGFPNPLDQTVYYCNSGDVFVEGKLSGQLTIGAANDIIVTGDLTYKGGHTGTDVLGLVAQGFVQVYHPVMCAPPNPVHSCPNGPYVNVFANTKDMTIDAAIMSVAHSFTVQNYNWGSPLGTLHLFGALAQEFRGPVGESQSGSSSPAHGYSKNYTYDTRLLNFPPPAYINPTDAQWQIQSFSEQPTP